MSNYLELDNYQDLFQLLEFQECREIFFWDGWNPFLHSLKGCDKEILMLFTMGFDGKLVRVGHLIF